MRSIGIGRDLVKTSEEDAPVTIEHQDGYLEVIPDAKRELGLITHEESRQVLPERDRVPQYRLSLDGDFAELDGEVDYYDDELTDPIFNPSFAFGASLAAYEAAERGELGEPENVKAHAKVQWIAAAGGVAFLGLSALAGLAVLGVLPWQGG